MREKPHATIQKRLPAPEEESAMGRKGFSPLFVRNEFDSMNIKTICLWKNAWLPTAIRRTVENSRSRCNTGKEKPKAEPTLIGALKVGRV